MYTRTGGLYTLHHHIHHRHTTPHSSTQLLDSFHCDELQARPPIERPFQIYLTIGPPDLIIDAPTIPKCCSEPPKTRPFSPITPPKRPRAILQVNVNLSPHSLHTHTALHQRQLLHLAQRRAAPGGDLDSYHARVIYAALDVRGDYYEDGEELTRVRVKN